MKKILSKLKEIDEKLSYKIFRSVPKTKKWKTILKFLEYSCHGFSWLSITTILVYLNPEFLPYTFLLGGLLIDVVYVALIKAYARRRRPIYAQQNDQLLLLSDKHSFPSGHCSRAIYIAFFAKLFAKNIYLFSIIIIWAISVSISRILLGRHHIFDVICGCLLGYFEYFLQFGLTKALNVVFVSLTSALLNVKINTNDMDDSELFNSD